MEQEIDVFLKITKTLPFKVRRLNSIKDVKAKIEQLYGISANVQDIFFNGKHLQDAETLRNFVVVGGSTLHVVQGSVTIVIPSLSKTINLDVMLSYTILTIKTLIEAKEGIQPERQVLCHGGKTLLSDTQTLVELDFEADYTIHLFVKPIEDLQIILSMERKTVPLEVKTWYRIQEVKDMIYCLKQIPTHEQILVHDGKRLEDHKTLSDSGIKKGSVIRLLLIFQIFVRTHEGTKVIEVNEMETINSIRNKVLAKLGIGQNNGAQKLFYGISLLKDSETLADYGISKNSTLELIGHW